jgi:hypothetical protein
MVDVFSSTLDRRNEMRSYRDLRNPYFPGLKRIREVYPGTALLIAGPIIAADG